MFLCDYMHKPWQLTAHGDEHRTTGRIPWMIGGKLEARCIGKFLSDQLQRISAAGEEDFATLSLELAGNRYASRSMAQAPIQRCDQYALHYDAIV
jgi:hypothetical protein